MSVAQEHLHDVRFPGESEDYRRARNELLAAERDLRRQIEAVAAQRRALPAGGAAAEYAFDGWDEVAGAPRTVRLPELFDEGSDTLFLYSFMLAPGERACPSCTSIIDAVDGEIRHVTQRISFAACSKAPIEEFRAHAQARGWRDTRLVSSSQTTYNHDYHAESPEGHQLPIATVFTRRDGVVRHFWSSELAFTAMDPGQHPRHVDFMWPLWAIFDTTPEGRGSDWVPALDYD
jgi:predicted dithiol-disulfide oxidoreductase (DUF899 family)